MDMGALHALRRTEAVLFDGCLLRYMHLYGCVLRLQRRSLSLKNLHKKGA